MTKAWTLTRDEAEYLVDLLEENPEDAFGVNWRSAYLAQELRDLFGMGKRITHRSHTPDDDTSKPA
jgi:hypothetical protein